MVKLKNYNKSFHSLILQKFNKKMLKQGKQNISDSVFLKMIFELKLNKDFNDRNVIRLYESFLLNVLIRFKIKFRKKGKVSQEVPVPIKDIQGVYQNTIAFLIKNFRNSKGSSLDKIFIKEVLDILKNQGSIKKQVLDLNKIVIKNRKHLN